MKCLLWSLIVSNLTLLSQVLWRAPEVPQGVPLPSHPLSAHSVWAAPDSSTALTHRALRRHAWIYIGLGVVTRQTPRAAYLKAGWALLELNGSFVLLKWPAVDSQVLARTALDLQPSRQAFAVL